MTESTMSTSGLSQSLCSNINIMLNYVACLGYFSLVGLLMRRQSVGCFVEMLVK